MERLRFALAGVSLLVPAAVLADVPAADLAPLTDEAVAALTPTEMAVVAAEVQLARAQAQAEQAARHFREAKDKLKLELLDLKAAKSEAKAARAQVDFSRERKSSDVVAVEQRAEGDVDSRQVNASTRLQQAQDEYDRIERLAAWKEAEADAAEQTAELAEQALEIAQLERTQARIVALRSANAATAARYAKDQAASKLLTAREKLGIGQAKLTTSIAKRDQLKAGYESLAPAAAPSTN